MSGLGCLGLNANFEESCHGSAVPDRNGEEDQDRDEEPRGQADTEHSGAKILESGKVNKFEEKGAGDEECGRPDEETECNETGERWGAKAGCLITGAEVGYGDEDPGCEAQPEGDHDGSDDDVHWPGEEIPILFGPILENAKCDDEDERGVPPPAPGEEGGLRMSRLG